jgi:protoporphyrinogen/coproporphyrinogen III oxidase
LNEPSVLVVGGGITGLAAAWQLATMSPQGVRVVLLEADKRLGGKLRTGEVGGRPVDLGPDAFLVRRDEALGLCLELGLGPELVAPASNRSFVWARGMLRPLPSGLALGVPTRLGPLGRSGICSPVGLGRAALDLLEMPMARRGKGNDDGKDEEEDDEAVGSIVRMRLGSEVHDRLADPLIGGIHAGPVDTMSAAAVFPQLLRANRRAGSLMRALRTGTVSPVSSPAGPLSSSAGADSSPAGPVFMTIRGGLERLVERLAAALEERGVEVRLGVRAERLERRAGPSEAGRWRVTTSAGGVDADGVVLALPGGDGARLVMQLDPQLAGLLGAIAYASVTLVTIRLLREPTGSSLEGTGFLVPRGERRLLTACTWLSSKWPEIDREGDVLLRASMGRYGDDRPSGMSDEEVVARSMEELRQMLGVRGEPVETLVTRWPESFPQYLVGHLRRVQSIEERAAHHPGLALAGAALHGVGIPACIGSGRNAANSLLSALADVG